MEKIDAEKKRLIDQKLKELKMRDDEEFARRKKALRERKNARDKRYKKEIERLENKTDDNGIKKQNNGLITAVVALSVLLLFFVSATVVFSDSANSYMTMAENAYNKAYYQLVMDMNNMETSLAKVLASNSNVARGRGLSELSSIAYSAESNISALPNESEEEKNAVVKFFNQVMDYSDYLADKLYRGTPLTEQEEENLRSLLSVNSALKNSLNSAFESGMDNPEKLFSSGILGNAEVLNPLDGAYKEVSEGSIEYPTLIYDGPFSDEKADAKEELKEGEGISEEDARKFAERLFEGYFDVNVEEIKADGYDLFSFTGDMDGKTRTVGIDKRSGMPVFMTSYREINGERITVNEGKDMALKFLGGLGFENLAVVWQNKKDGILTLNIAYKDEGTVYYSRLIKVSLALDDGEVLGLESATYLANKDKAHDVKTSISMEEARKLVNKKLEIKAERLTVIPINSKEMTAYEFHGTMDGMIFYVYIDGNTGEEINVLRVIENDEQGQIVL